MKIVFFKSIRFCFSKKGKSPSSWTDADDLCRLSVAIFLFRDTFFLLGGIAEIELVLKIFLCGNQSGLRQLFVEAGNFNLFAVFRHFFEIVGGSELLKLLLEVIFHFH